MNQTIRLSARCDAGHGAHALDGVSGNVCAKSTLGVLLRGHPESALACSIVTEALSSRPRKRPTCTKTSVTAKATPATVIDEAQLVVEQVLASRGRPCQLSLAERGRGSMSLDEACRDRLARVGATRSTASLQLGGDLQRDDAVRAGPDASGRPGRRR